jgi:RNA polymerase nonessential primary-like sigma factor
MQTIGGVHPVSQRLLEFAYECLSFTLQLDYLSNGNGRRKSTRLRAPRTTMPAMAGTQPRSRDIIQQYLGEVATRRRLSSSEEYRLATRARKGDLQARARLIEHQLGLVVMLARPYRDRGLPLLDLIEEGNIGLLRAMEKFDPERGCRFSTYAKWWIGQSIELALMNQATTVRVPVHVRRALKKELKAGGAKLLPPPGVAGKYLLHDVRHEVDIDGFGQHGDPQGVVDQVAAPEHEQPDWHLHVSVRRRHLEAAMLQLKDTERWVLQSRFGLADDNDCTLHSVAQQLNLSSERVRQIQAEALSKLRSILQTEHGENGDALL